MRSLVSFRVLRLYFSFSEASSHVNVRSLAVYKFVVLEKAAKRDRKN